MRRILVGVDFSEGSRRALSLALQLSSRFGARLHVVHVLPQRLTPTRSAETLRLLDSRRVELDLGEFVVELSKGGAEELERVDRRLLEGDVADQLLREAEVWGATLLVAGSHGRSALGRLFLGSVSSALVQRARLPVLVVPAGEASELPSSLLVAAEEDGSLEPVLAAARQWREALGAKLAVCHVFDDAPEPIFYRFSLETQVHREFERERARVRATLEETVATVFARREGPALLWLDGRPSPRLRRELEAGGYDLVLIGKHEKHELLDLRDTTLSLVHRAPCPVLVVPPAVERDGG